MLWKQIGTSGKEPFHSFTVAYAPWVFLMVKKKEKKKKEKERVKRGRVHNESSF